MKRVAFALFGTFIGFGFGIGLALAPVASAIDIQVVPITDEVDAWLVEDHTNPLVTLKFGFEGGSRWDQPGKEGTASLAFGSLNEGAGDMDAETFLGMLQDEAVSMAGKPGFNSLGQPSSPGELHCAPAPHACSPHR